ncbi:MAG TPA: DUF423 domain-containing protein [Chromatiales bacterium]|nr:DUF423 domain-containing protein [Chromatiales bacterium]
MDRQAHTNARLFLLAGTLLGGLGVALGAFGAHGLQKMLDARLFEVYETAVLYQFLHALALLIAGLWLRQGGAASLLRVAGWAWIAGVALFSGSLYIYVFTGVHWLAIVTPVGGTLFILGWLAAARAAWKQTTAP